MVVLGSQGMLGYEVTRTLRDEGFEVQGTVRGRQNNEGSLHFNFDGSLKSVNEFFSLVQDTSVVVNCIGLIPQKQTSTNKYRDYISVNAMLPSFLDSSATKFGFKVIQIATDCVFSGNSGMYSEESCHDATDIYGITKSMGEINSPNFLNLRCSIIGSEIQTSVSLHDWLLQQETGAKVNGYVDHLWNGLTTLSFAKIVSGILRSGSDFSGTRHIVPRNHLSKFELLKVIAKNTGRNDLVISEFHSGTSVDRRLMTHYPEYNEQLWVGAGYASIPNVEDMVEEFENNGLGATYG